MQGSGADKRLQLVLPASLNSDVLVGLHSWSYGAKDETKKIDHVSIGCRAEEAKSMVDMKDAKVFNLSKH